MVKFAFYFFLTLAHFLLSSVFITNISHLDISRNAYMATAAEKKEVEQSSKRGCIWCSRKHWYVSNPEMERESGRSHEYVWAIHVGMAGWVSPIHKPGPTRTPFSFPDYRYDGYEGETTRSLPYIDMFVYEYFCCDVLGQNTGMSVSQIAEFFITNVNVNYNQALRVIIIFEWGAYAYILLK